MSLIPPQVLSVAIVDDEPGMCAGAQRVLCTYAVELADINEHVTFVAQSYGSGEALFDALETGHRFDIMLLDCKLPGIGGIEILERLQQQKQQILTIMISAYASLETAVRATKLGAYDFLAKPFTPDELRYTIRKACRNVVLTRKTRALEQERQQVRFQFISILAHELKAPINAIEGFLDIMKKRVLGNDMVGYDEMVERSLARIGGMRKLVLDLLDLTAIESGRKNRVIEKIDITTTAQTVAESYRQSAATRNITITVAANDPILLTADRSEIEMVLNNLVSNAVKYNREGGQVAIALKENAGTVTIEVADTGIGMSDSEISRLFVEFCRIKNEQTQGIPGSGLGLSIVRKLAVLYDGHVAVQSRPNEGTRITVVLKDSGSSPSRTTLPATEIQDINT